MRFADPRAESGRLARRYFIAIGGAISIVLLLAMAIETPLSYRGTLDRVGDVQLAELRSAAARVRQYLAAVEDTLRESAGIPWSTRPFGEDDQRAEFHRLMKLVPSIDSIQAVDAGGNIRLAAARRDLDRPATTAFGNPALLVAAREKGSALGSVAFRGGIEPVVTLAVRGATPGSGVLLAELNLRNVSDIVAGLDVGKAGQAFMLDGDGRVIAHRDPSRTLLGASETAAAQMQAIRARLRGGSDTVAPFEVRNADGVAVLASAVKMPGTQWIVVAEEPLDAALRPVRATVYRLVALMLAGLALAVVLSGLMARRLSRPILALRDGAARIARGDLAARLDVRTGDEVEALARDFNAMAAQLEDHTTGLERKVEEKTAKLQEAMRARALFLAAASHDLRQPLYAISILADTLALHELPEGARETLARQREAIAVLRGLFDNLLDLSRFESGDVRANLRVVSLREILGPVAMEHEVVARAKGLGWEAQIVEAWAHTDPELLRRMTANLLSNAVRYTARGRVSMSARIEGERILLRIADTGIGIAVQNQSRVFEEFVQLENPGRDRDRGVGLGLSIVKRIDAILGTHLRLESTVGLGTGVSFTIPLASVGPTGADARAPSDIAATDLAGMRVWVVEDDVMVRDALAGQLGAWSVDYAFAAGREQVEALRDADAEWPDAVILDDMLGSESGLDIAAWLAEHVPRERLVLVTGNVEPGRIRLLEASGIALLRKPVSSQVLARWLHGARRVRPDPRGSPAGALAG